MDLVVHELEEEKHVVVLSVILLPHHNLVVIHWKNKKEVKEKIRKLKTILWLLHRGMFTYLKSSKLPLLLPGSFLVSLNIN
jgi:hypothetical protein